MSLKELASLAPWNWDPQAAKHPPKRAALQDFEKIESAWRHDDTAHQTPAPAPTPRERRRSTALSAASNSMEVGWETPNASGLARKAASADRARSLLKRKAIELQTPDSQKHPPTQQQPSSSSLQTRDRQQDRDAAPDARVTPVAARPTAVLCPAQQPSLQPQPPRARAEAAGGGARATDDRDGTACAAADDSTRNIWMAANEAVPAVGQTPAATQRDLAMRPPRWTPAGLRGSVTQLQPSPATGRRVDWQGDGTCAVDGDGRTFEGTVVGSAVQLPSAAAPPTTDAGVTPSLLASADAAVTTTHVVGSAEGAVDGGLAGVVSAARQRSNLTSQSRSGRVDGGRAGSQGPASAPTGGARVQRGSASGLPWAMRRYSRTIILRDLDIRLIMEEGGERTGSSAQSDGEAAAPQVGVGVSAATALPLPTAEVTAVQDGAALQATADAVHVDPGATAAAGELRLGQCSEGQQEAATAAAVQSASCCPTVPASCGRGSQRQSAAVLAGVYSTPGGVTAQGMMRPAGRPAPGSAGMTDTGRRTAAATLTMGEPCSSPGGSSADARLALLPPSAAVNDNPSSTPLRNQAGAHSRGDVHGLLWSDTGPSASALATRLSVDGHTPYSRGDRLWLSPASRQRPSAARTMRTPLQRHLSSSSPMQPPRFDPSPASRKQPQQAHKMQLEQQQQEQEHLDCGGGNAAAVLAAASVGNLEAAAASGIAARPSLFKLTPTTHRRFVLQGSVVEGVSSVQPRNSATSPKDLSSTPPSDITTTTTTTHQAPALWRPHIGAQDNGQGFTSVAANGPGQSPVSGAHEGQVLSAPADLCGLLQATATIISQGPVPEGAVSPGQAMPGGPDVDGGCATVTGGQPLHGADLTACNGSMGRQPIQGVTPRAALAMRQGSQAPPAALRTRNAEENVTMVVLPAGACCGSQGSEHQRAASAAARAIRAGAGTPVPRFGVSSTTGISGSAAGVGSQYGGFGALDKGTVQRAVTPARENAASLDSRILAPAGTAMEASPPHQARDSKTSYDPSGGSPAVTMSGPRPGANMAITESGHHQTHAEKAMEEKEGGGMAAGFGAAADGGCSAELLRPAKRQAVEAAAGGLNADAIKVSAQIAAKPPEVAVFATVAMTELQEMQTEQQAQVTRQSFDSPDVAGGGLAGDAVGSPKHAAEAKTPTGKASAKGDAASAAAMGEVSPGGVCTEQPSLPHVTLTQQQLVVLDQLLTFFRATGCRHPSAMSAAELVAAISSFCQSAGIPVVPSNIQTLASWLGTLMALEKPVKAYAQAQALALARARAQDQQQQSENPELPQPPVQPPPQQPPEQQQARTEPSPEHQLQQQQQQEQLPQPAAGALAHESEPGGAVSAKVQAGQDDSQPAGGAAGDGEGHRGSGAPRQGDDSLQGVQERPVGDSVPRIGEQLQQVPGLQVQSQRCPTCLPSAENAPLPQQQRQQPLVVRDSAADPLAMQAGGRMASGGSETNRCPEPPQPQLLPILPLDPAKPLGPTPLESLSSEWSSPLSPAVTALYERLASCQQALRSALLSVAAAQSSSSYGAVSSYTSQRQQSTGSAEASVHASAAPAATVPAATIAATAVPAAAAANGAAASAVTDAQALRSGAQHSASSYTPSALAQQLHLLLTRHHQHSHQPQQQQVQAWGAGPAESTKPGLMAAAAATAGSGGSGGGTEASAWPAAVQPPALTASRVLSWPPPHPIQLPGAVPGGVGPRASSSSSGNGCNGGAAAGDANKGSYLNQQDARPGRPVHASPEPVDHPPAAAAPPPPPLQLVAGNTGVPAGGGLLARDSQTAAQPLQSQSHEIQSALAAPPQSYTYMSGTALPAAGLLPGWGARQGHHCGWTVTSGTAAATAPAAPGASTAVPGPASQSMMPPPTRPQGQAIAAGPQPGAMSSEPLASSRRVATGSDTAAVVQPAPASRLAHPSLATYGSAPTTAAGTAANRIQLPVQAAAQAAMPPSTFLYHAYDIAAARAPQHSLSAAAPPVPNTYSRPSGMSMSGGDDASMLQPSPVQTPTVTAHAAAAAPYAHAMGPYSYLSAAAGHSWHYASTYGWCPSYGSSGRATVVPEPGEPFAYTYTARGTAVPYGRPAAGTLNGGSLQGAAPAAATEGLAAAVQPPRVGVGADFEALQPPMPPPPPAPLQLQQQMPYAPPKTGNRRAKHLGLPWGLQGYPPPAGQAYGHLPAGMYSARLKGIPGWGGAG